MDYIKTIDSIIQTLDSIPVAGLQNMDRMLGINMVLQKMKTSLQQDADRLGGDEQGGS